MVNSFGFSVDTTVMININRNNRNSARENGKSKKKFLIPHNDASEKNNLLNDHYSKPQINGSSSYLLSNKICLFKWI